MKKSKDGSNSGAFGKVGSTRSGSSGGNDSGSKKGMRSAAEYRAPSKDTARRIIKVMDTVSPPEMKKK